MNSFRIWLWQKIFSKEVQMIKDHEELIKKENKELKTQIKNLQNRVREMDRTILFLNEEIKQ